MKDLRLLIRDQTLFPAKAVAEGQHISTDAEPRFPAYCALRELHCTGGTGFLHAPSPVNRQQTAQSLASRQRAVVMYGLLQALSACVTDYGNCSPRLEEIDKSALWHWHSWGDVRGCSGLGPDCLSAQWVSRGSCVLLPGLLRHIRFQRY